MTKLIHELKEDEKKLNRLDESMQLKLYQVPELIKGELANLAEEQKEIDEKIDELSCLPETPPE